jgi:hypothetical protein
VLTTRVFEYPSGRFIFAKAQPFSCEVAGELPAVPALPQTLVALEFQLREKPVDLAEFSAAVLGDLGATIQILRLAGREYGDAEDRPVRIEDCIADLGLEACFKAAQSGTFVKGAFNRTVFETWSHSREIARSCWQLADAANAIVHPYEAYLAGLLHGLGSLPAILGWPSSETFVDRNLAALRMAEHWSFPVCLKEFFSEVNVPGRNPQVSSIVAEAHRLADPSGRCPLAELAAPSRASINIK